jgi:DNA-binding NtrC family response regulator
MAVCTPENSATLPSSNTLVVSDDPALAEHLRSLLEQDHRRQVSVAATFREAEAYVDQQVPETVFIDFRKAQSGENPGALLERLGQRGPHRVPVIAVSESGYICDWAVVADLIVAGRLELPLDRTQLSRLLDGEVAKHVFHHAPDSMTPKVVKGETVTYKTYTPEIFQLLDDVLTMAAHDVTMLLVGETGTGKTTLAKLIHELSSRKKEKLLTVACGALPPELIESELFGHVKGAFTSADHTKTGKFEAAKNGSLLLDEIDVLGPAQQAKLLRVIETGEFEPVGSNDTRCSRARLIVASNVDLKELMARNEFRADLYYRLNMLEFRIPPLRERKSDIVPMTLDFIDEFCENHGIEIRRVHPDFLTCLKRYEWPGNVRELKNHVRRAVLFCRTGELTPDQLAPHFRESLNGQPNEEDSDCGIGGGLTAESTFVERLALSEREILKQALQEHSHNRTATAKSLGLSRVGLYKKMKKYGMITPRAQKNVSPS